jgi:hypothetical protein
MRRGAAELVGGYDWAVPLAVLTAEGGDVVVRGIDGFNLVGVVEDVVQLMWVLL